MHNLEDLPLRAKTGEYHAVIETPRDSGLKFIYDGKTGMFCAKRLLGLGLTFPFPFGFLPSTRGEDGDPLDVLVISDLTLPTGCLVRVGIIGMIKAEQEQDGRRFRNDRYLATPLVNGGLHGPRRLSELEDSMVTEIETFLVTYVEEEGRTLHLLGRGNGAEAEQTIEKLAAGRKH